MWSNCCLESGLVRGLCVKGQYSRNPTTFEIAKYKEQRTKYKEPGLASSLLRNLSDNHAANPVVDGELNAVTGIEPVQ